MCRDLEGVLEEVVLDLRLMDEPDVLRGPPGRGAEGESHEVEASLEGGVTPGTQALRLEITWKPEPGCREPNARRKEL